MRTRQCLARVQTIYGKRRCQKPIHSCGLCSGHYQRARKAGELSRWQTREAVSA